MDEQFYESLRKYLASYISNLRQLPSSARSNAKDKLSRLTRTQYHELATDVYDEMQRRIKNSVERIFTKFILLYLYPLL